ncbi:uncharacterized protein LOC133180520 [Saccostrea echinata]|uniref:uncharacterized protein LOC133180520 n=1 Tax=Saccostrea echinata TaxID=191078 RepID=UPI002A83401B|nr:uncharacterized protein LOC133180520 [Saccostrea echinata]
MGILTCGLGSFLKVQCQNTTCQHVNKIATGKRHGKIWDANTKLATGMVHTGMGPSQVNALLTSLNIPPISSRTLQNRQNETGTVMEKTAVETTRSSLHDEIQATLEYEGTDELTVSVDAGWQKRGSGRSFDSLSGHCSMIGSQTGKIIDYDIRTKCCKICESATRSGKDPKDHDCRKNWEGSSKAMEKDMVAKMVSRKMEEGVNITNVVADEDTTTFCHLRNIHKNITKISDKNHIRKIFSSNLYGLQLKHRSLSTKVIRYLVKCFNYMISQNKGNPVGVQRGLEALSRHPFGDHSACNESWCSHISNPKQKYSALPYGKPLKDSHLQESIQLVCSKLLKDTSKLSRLGSTQANEAFNKSVSLKAPKNHHFGGSASLSYRVAASVAEKNAGQTYLVEVNRRVGLSPGKHTRKFCYLRDSQSRKRKAIARTKNAKRKRMQLKAKKCQTTACKEIREGPTYESGVGISDSNTVVDEIPPPSSAPQPQILSTKDKNFVFFDLETTGLARTSHILQVAAICGKETFSSYVMPKKQITPSASTVTGLKLDNGTLYHHERKVNAVSISSALGSFLSFIEKQGNVILVGHNIKSFDVHVLFHALDSCSLLDRMSKCVQGFLDTKFLFKLVHPNLCSYRQEHLSEVLLNCTYNAHDAVEDVSALQRLFDTVHFCDDEHSSSTFTFQYALSVHNYQKVVDRNIPSLKCLIDKNVLSVRMARKVAGSGLDFDCLRLAHSRSPDGINNLFTEQCDNKSVRVTKCKKIIDIVTQFFMSLNES